MRKRIWFRSLVAAALAAAIAMGAFGCTGVPAGALSGVKLGAGNMLHVQQVLERYDADGKTVPQYLEFWLAKDKGKCVEMDKEGNALSVALDTGKSHLMVDAATLKARKSNESLLFVLNFGDMKKAYPKLRKTNGGEYAGRPCTFYLMDNGNEDEWVKLYVDSATGYVLLCDAPTFRLRTALIEEAKLDDALFTEPKDLSYEGGDGK